MITLSGMDVKYIVRELQELEKSIVEKIYQPAGKEMILALHKSGSGKKLLKIVPGQAVYLTKEKGEQKETPTAFSMTLRKYLQQARVTEITQPEVERIVEIGFSNDHKVIIELFSKGNIILMDQKGKIIALLERQEWKHRTLEKGKQYVYPPPTINPFKLSEEEFRNRYERSAKDSAVKILATDFALGGKYAEEVCAMAKIDKKKKKIDAIKVWKSIQSLESKKIRPHITSKGLKQELIPIEMVSEEEAPKQYFNTISEALEYYEKNFGEEVIQKQEEKERLQELASMQKGHVEELKKEAEEFRKIGDLLYTQYADVDFIIKEINAKKWNVSNSLIKEMKKAEGKVIIEL